MIKEPIQSADVFLGLSPSELDIVEQKSVKRAFQRDEVIFREGETGDKMYLILKGVVEIWKSEGKAIKGSRLARLETGELFGEMSLFDKKPRSASAIASIDEETTLLIWDEETLDQLIQEHPRMANKIQNNIIKKISDRLRQADEAIHILLRSSQYTSL